MNAITWVILIGIVVAAVARRAGGVTRGMQALQRQAAEAQAAMLTATRPADVPPLPPLAAAPPRRPPPAAVPRPVLAQPPRAAEAPLRTTLRAAFADPAHARTAVILAEILAPPVALR